MGWTLDVGLSEERKSQSKEQSQNKSEMGDVRCEGQEENDVALVEAGELRTCGPASWRWKRVRILRIAVETDD